MKKVIIALSLFAFISLATIPVSAEIEEIAVPCGQEPCFNWWPKLPKVEGWHQDVNYSVYYGANVQAPDGYTFHDAETVIFAKALYKPNVPDAKSLDDLIQDNKAEFLSRNPDTEISEVEMLSTKDGQQLKSFTVFPKKNGNWKRISYGEEGDYYLVFTISARTKDGFAKSIDAYKKFINDYKEKP